MCKSNCGCGGGAMCTIAMVSKILLIVGGLNWGLVGLGMLLGKMESWNVVNMLLGSMPTIEAIVYVLVGIAALSKAFGGCRCSTCSGGACMSCAPGEKTEVKM